MFNIENIPPELAEKDNAALLTGILRGAERESLRVDSNGTLAFTPHPQGLGSAVAHPEITTDFSEALMEFITPPTHSTCDLINHLHLLQNFTAHQLPENELLWSHSMPCALGPDSEIPVAQYGSSNNGQMKTVYRVGLGHRYGRSMQTVAGVHYNFSLPNAFWAFLLRRENLLMDLQQFKNHAYFGLIRNFRRHYWLLIYLFGASPALCRSFVAGRNHHLQPVAELEHTLHLPYATSLRMGDLGYQSSAQESLYVCYNQQKSYIETLCSAITTPHIAYETIGVKDTAGEYRQLNTGLLQIENEFYSSIRPKRTAKPGETALMALANRGVEYIEVRCLDANPSSPEGITEEQIRFLDTFLLYCALQKSPDTNREETEMILANQKAVVDRGREPGLMLARPGGSLPMSSWASGLLAAMGPVAELLDNAHETTRYSASLQQQKAKVDNPDLTPSAQLLNTLKSTRTEYARFALQQSKANHTQLLDSPLSGDVYDRMVEMAANSVLEQHNLEEKSRQSGLDFDEFLKRYYSQYRMCCGAFV
ncbi:glutamate--cysteine ligase [Teredinibacter turnerae]|uniref:glutamate--cysteine ligase n=1 Tax=Teredinibacter turnerae TaxID=2426 RepID=UPI0004092119|nr:glutamate--cysteine ligase [Teredinibacter turnerae]